MFCFIINPAARSGRGRRIWEKLREELDHKNVEYRYYFTSKERSAGRIVRCILKANAGTVTVVLLGGDGTVNELLQGVAASGEDCFERLRLGYIPTGSASDLARALELPANQLEGLRRILAAGDGHISYVDGTSAARERSTDLGVLEYLDAEKKEYNGRKRYFAVSAGMGFDAAVCAEASVSATKKALNRIGLGGLSYGFICVKRLLGAPRTDCTVIMDRKEAISAHDCLFVTVMNNRFQGGGVMFAPEAVSNDGMLDLCFTDRISRGKVLITFPKAYSGSHVGTKGIILKRAKEARIAATGYLWVHTDGEVKTKAKEVSIRCLPGKLRLLL
ncbi:MAG: hypothetical protein K6E50_06850 [Lachnospiraceae bacterium]|nr:hypothetical protein [Lachnospiraceae bacterium]